MEQKRKSKITERFMSLIFYLSIIFFFIAFNFQDSRTNGWYQQFMPNLGGKQITDITFLDSLTGYAVARQTSDSSYIIKTTNGGDNWIIIYRNYYMMTGIQFLNMNTGYACGAYLYKTTNGGFNWNQVNAPSISPEKVYALNEDTIWIISSDGLVGGAFLTTNGGLSWQVKYTQSAANPYHIYMYNERIGFMDGGGLKKTIDGGNSWLPITGEGQFTDIYFIDSLTGWKANGFIKKTTNGGLNWVNQPLPEGGYIYPSQLDRFSIVNKDTIWGVGGAYSFVNGQRGIVYRTTNGGTNWYYQVPDTTIHIYQYKYIKFINKKIGWIYSASSGAHTIVGGDSAFVMSSNQNSYNIPDKYRLEQNYPNPFNPSTTIRFSINKNAYVNLSIYDLTGKEIIKVYDNKLLNEGNYKVTLDFNMLNLPSGVYFYVLRATDEKQNQIFSQSRKMVYLK
jgi:photosystem II stability/assembly factor-like uncharacterized protein